MKGRGLIAFLLVPMMMFGQPHSASAFLSRPAQAMVVPLDPFADQAIVPQLLPFLTRILQYRPIAKISSYLIPSAPRFEQTIKAEGWGIINTQSLDINRYVEELTQAYQNAFGPAGPSLAVDEPPLLAIGKPGHYEIDLDPKAERALDRWAQTILKRLQKLFPEEDLEIAGIELGVGWRFRFTDSQRSQPLYAHVDGSEHFVALYTLHGESATIYPHSTQDFFEDTAFHEPEGLGEAVVPETGMTVIISGDERARLLAGQIKPTVHSSPLVLKENRVTFLLAIRPKVHKPPVLSDGDARWSSKSLKLILGIVVWKGLGFLIFQYLPLPPILTWVGLMFSVMSGTYLIYKKVLSPRPWALPRSA